MDDSQKAFLIDQWIRSQPSQASFYSMGAEESEKEIILESLSPQYRELTLRAYDHILESLERQVVLCVPEERVPKKVLFHPKFGWTLQSGGDLVYLGKVDALSCRLKMGRCSYISGSSSLRGIGELTIGQFCSIANGVTFLSSNTSHPTQFMSTYNLGGNQRIKSEAKNLSHSYYEGLEWDNQISIGHDVWIGEGVTIKNGVKIGNGAVLGMGALVTKDCEPFGIYGGVPARLIRYRFNEATRKEIEEMAWWDWPMERIQKEERLFLRPLEE
jgi:acetyltransferase-like isoleucine patch superfamily enzyme